MLLGEFNHGSREVFVSRNDLIKSLHENLGFDVILFEAGIGELSEINFYKKTLAPEQMTKGFFGIWRTKEFERLMQYIKENQIEIGGFDVQRSGAGFNKLLRAEAIKIGIDSLLYNHVENQFSKVSTKWKDKNVSFDTNRKLTLELINSYKIVDEIFKSAISNNSGATKAIHLVEKTIANRIVYLKYRLDFLEKNNYRERFKARDMAMAENVEWLISNFYKDEKVIIIGHNFHTSKFNKNEVVMGELLKTKYGDNMYSLATYAGKGVYHGNSGNEKEIKVADSLHLDIKHIIQLTNGRVHFINIPQKQKKETHWIFNNIVTNDSFIDLNGSNKIIISKHFDGLLLFDSVSPPKK